MTILPVTSRTSFTVRLLSLAVMGAVVWYVAAGQLLEDDTESERELEPSYVEALAELEGTHFPEQRSDLPVVELTTDAIILEGRSSYQLSPLMEIVDDQEVLESKYRMRELRELPIDEFEEDITRLMDEFSEEERPNTVRLQVDGFALSFWLDRLLVTLQRAGVEFVVVELPPWLEETVSELTTGEDNQYFFELSFMPDGLFHGCHSEVKISLSDERESGERGWSYFESNYVDGKEWSTPPLFTTNASVDHIARGLLRALWRENAEVFEGLFDDPVNRRAVEYLSNRTVFELRSHAELPVWISIGIGIQYEEVLQQTYELRKPDRNFIRREGVDFLHYFWHPGDSPKAKLRRHLSDEEIINRGWYLPVAD